MSASPPLGEVTTALLTLLRGAGHMIFDGAYAGDGDGDGDDDADPIRPPYWYAILYRIPGGNADTMPDLDDRHQTVTVPYQCTAVGATRNQAEAADRILRDRILERGPTGAWVHDLALPAGWVCCDRQPDPVMAGVDAVGEAPSRVFSLPARFYLTITPA